MTAQGIIASCSTGPLMVAPPALTGSGAPSSSFKGILGQSYFDTSTSPRTAYVFTGAEWILDAQSAGDVNSVTGTANQITATTTLGDVVLTIPSAFIAPGSITATTTLTATLGNITATDGNIVRGTAGNKDVYTSVATNGTAGANSAGTATLAGGTITINTTAVTANSIIRLYRQGIGATGAAALGILTRGTIVAGTSFVINSVQAADATALQASDVSVVAWEIVN